MTGMLVNLVLAVFWLFLGAAILAYEHTNEPLKWRLPGNMSPGWFAILLAGYNLIRVFTIWKFSPRPKAPGEEELEAVRPRHASHREEPPDPNFQFTDSPPKPAETKPEQP